VVKAIKEMRNRKAAGDDVESIRDVVAHGDVRGGSEGETGEWSGSQYNSTLPRNMVCPTLLPTIKTCDKLLNSMVVGELNSKIIQLISTSLFPYNTYLTVDTVSSVVSSIMI
jgi:hypothetical protein